MASDSLSVVLEKMYENQLGLKAALMELVLLAEQPGHHIAGENARGALTRIGDNAGHIKQGLARLRAKEQR